MTITTTITILFFRAGAAEAAAGPRGGGGWAGGRRGGRSLERTISRPPDRNLKASEEHIQKHVSSCFIVERYVHNCSGLGSRAVWKLFIERLGRVRRRRWRPRPHRRSLLRKPLPCNLAAETAIQSLIWCYESSSSKGPSSVEECVCSQTPVSIYIYIYIYIHTHIHIYIYHNIRSPRATRPTRSRPAARSSRTCARGPAA